MKKAKESETGMKLSILVVLAVLVSLPAHAQDQSSCKAYFQVLRADSKAPGLRAGMDSAQKKWWDNEGQKKYPGLCLNGAVMSPDKPRYLVIWSKSKSIAPTSPAPTDVYGQTTAALQATAPTTKIYTRRWNLASITIVNLYNDGTLLLPPVYFETEDLGFPLRLKSAKILEASVKYLWQERVFLTKPD
jgi:hypothetical protein